MTADAAAHPMLPQRPYTIDAFVPTHAGTTTNRSNPDSGFHRGMAAGKSRDPANQVRRLLTDHDR
ncbi:hypothetical protein M3559_14215, partial [Staphylococcus equorum]|uniref:hypothetical protein n=1 Tax=Staphylococcus equorum TaxID=246432 RepID=UPI00203EB935